MSRITLIAAAALFATLNVGMAVAPAHAASMDADTACEVMPADLRAAAQGAEPRKAQRALSKTDIGVALCEAGNERAGAKKFRQAMKALGITEEQFAQR